MKTQIPCTIHELIEKTIVVNLSQEYVEFMYCIFNSVQISLVISSHT